MRLLKFNAVGAMGAAVQLAVLAVLVHAAGVHYLWATGLSVEAAILHNFVWHRRWTWGERRGSTGNPIATLARFNLSSGLVSISGNLLSAYALTGLLHFHPVISNLVAIATGSLVNLLLFDRVVFVQHGGSTRKDAAVLNSNANRIVPINLTPCWSRKRRPFMPHIIWVIILVSLTFGRATAQTPDDSWENLKQLQPGHKVKVVDVKFRAWSGKLVSVSDDAMIVRREGKKEEVTVERANVLRVTDLQVSHRRRNALLGLAAGSVLGFGLVANEGDLTGWGKAVIAVGIFGGPGAAIGVLFPGPRPTLYRAPKPLFPAPASNSSGLNAGE